MTKENVGIINYVHQPQPTCLATSSLTSGASGHHGDLPKPLERDAVDPGTSLS
jgi:hypothetical protein